MNESMSERRLARTIEWLGTVEGAMSSKLILLSPDTPVEDALVLLEGRDATWGVVVEAGHVVGGVAVSDLAAHWASAWCSAPARLGHTRLHVADVMTSNETLVGAADPLMVAILKMDDAGTNHLTVVEGTGRPVGLISRRDVIAALARCVRGRPNPHRRSVSSAAA